jgi:TRAP-type transport system periplasmic protein
VCPGWPCFPKARGCSSLSADPVLKPADFARKTVRAPRSDTSYALLKAFGATPDDLMGVAFPEGIAAGEVVAADSSFVGARSLPEPTTAAANLVLYSKFNSLVANAKTFQSLSEAQRQALKDAAAATRTWAAEVMKANGGRRRCLLQGRCTVVTATEDEIAAFKAAGAPVYAKLEADPETKTRIAKIRELAAGEPVPAAIRPCRPGYYPRSAAPKPDAYALTIMDRFRPRCKSRSRLRQAVRRGAGTLTAV